MGELLNSEQRIAKIETLIDNVLELTGVVWGFCPKCRSKVQVEVPDLKGRVDGIIKLLEQSEGKPRDGEQAGTTIIVERPAR